jgi:hypothetical protein
MPNPRNCTPGFDIGTDDAPYVSGFNIREEPSPSIAKPDDSAVTLRGVQVPLNSDIGSAFVTDLSRNKERLFSDQQVCEKYDIAPDNWTTITQNKALRLLVNAEHERRMLNGTAAQESAAKIFTEAPEVLGSILRDQQASPRYRIEASRELRATARAGDEKPGTNSERVIIRIDLGADTRAKGLPNDPADVLVFDTTVQRNADPNPDPTNTTTDQTIDQTPMIEQDQIIPIKRGRGRPPGSKNKPKQPELPMQNQS